MNRDPIVDYIMVIAYSADSLPSEVKDYLKLGYRPWGAPFIKGQSHETLCQAMVKYQSDEIKE